MPEGLRLGADPRQHPVEVSGVGGAAKRARDRGDRAGGGEVVVQPVGSRLGLQQARGAQGRAVAANLPSHIPQRMADRARSLLAQAGIDARIEPLRVRAASPGAGLFLSAEYERVHGGFGALGERGKASEVVAEEAVAEVSTPEASAA